MITVGREVRGVRLDLLTWEALSDMARKRQCSIADLLAEIHGTRKHRNLTTAIRNHVVAYYRASAEREISRRAMNTAVGDAEEMIATCIERHTRRYHLELAHIILEGLWEAGCDVVRRAEHPSGPTSLAESQAAG